MLIFINLSLEAFLNIYRNKLSVRSAFAPYVFCYNPSRKKYFPFLLRLYTQGTVECFSCPGKPDLIGLAYHN